ncbi:MAG: PIG-L deacetylase family protein [Candidatus Levyibacteriota bacterium]
MDEIKRNVVLAVGAHPDDMDFGASATVAKFVEEGAKAYYLICTDGSRGSEDPTMTHERLAKIREEEQHAAGNVLGLTDVFFLKHPDTQLVADLTLKEEIVRVIRTVRPDTVITMDPAFLYTASEGWTFINHTDHRAMATATMDAVFPLSRDRLTFPEHEKEGLMPHKVRELLFVNFLQPSYLVDVSTTFQKKIAALRCHKSQFADFEAVKERMRMRGKMLGKEKGFDYAESFTRLLIS